MKTDKKLVLIVDDDEDILFQMKLNLAETEYEIMTAGSEKEARKILEDTRPDLVILDLMMENRDSGFVLSHSIKRLDPMIKVILVTAVTSETGMEFDASTPDERRWVKADTIMSKPVRKDQLLREIDSLMGA
ncbi:response regulator [bacterium]|nr:response regulator [candidate division CSSED10-310 bacterium]